jgi:hypothetical protein
LSGIERKHGPVRLGRAVPVAGRFQPDAQIQMRSRILRGRRDGLAVQDARLLQAPLAFRLARLRDQPLGALEFGGSPTIGSGQSPEEPSEHARF